MSYDPCKYCGEMAFKTNGNAEFICYNRANTGSCESTAEFDHQEKRFAAKKPGNEPCVCGSGKKSKNCKCKKR